MRSRIIGLSAVALLLLGQAALADPVKVTISGQFDNNSNALTVGNATLTFNAGGPFYVPPDQGPVTLGTFSWTDAHSWLDINSFAGRDFDLTITESTGGSVTAETDVHGFIFSVLGQSGSTLNIKFDEEVAIKGSPISYWVGSAEFCLFSTSAPLPGEIAVTALGSSVPLPNAAYMGLALLGGLGGLGAMRRKLHAA